MTIHSGTYSSAYICSEKKLGVFKEDTKGRSDMTDSIIQNTSNSHQGSFRGLVAIALNGLHCY